MGGTVISRNWLVGTRPRRYSVAVPLDRIRAAFAGTNPDRFLDARDEDLAIADAAGMGRLLDRLDGPLDHRIFHDDFDLHLREEVDDVLSAAIELGVAFLPTETLGLDHGDALDPDLVQSLFHFIKLERLDDRFDFFHWSQPPMPKILGCRHQP